MGKFSNKAQIEVNFPTLLLSNYLEENVNMAFTLLWHSKYMLHQLSFRNGASVHILRAMTPTIPSFSDVKQKKRLPSFVAFSRLALVDFLCSAYIPTGVNIEVNV